MEYQGHLVASARLLVWCICSLLWKILLDQLRLIVAGRNHGEYSLRFPSLPSPHFRPLRSLDPRQFVCFAPGAGFEGDSGRERREYENASHGCSLAEHICFGRVEASIEDFMELPDR
jgi:hypothetical protein